MENINSKIALLVVLFWPSLDEINKIIVYSKYGYKVIVVSNSSKEEHLSLLRSEDNILLIENSKNLGLASALNIGIRCAFEYKTIEGIICLDQDSSIEADMPVSLFIEYTTSNVKKIACLTPKLIDVKQPKTRVGDKDSAIYQDILTAATSGSYLPRTVLEDIGLMDETLFIDCIDHDWCFRARAKGYKIYRSNKIVLKHNMGDYGVNFLGKFKPIHISPIRHYYIIRNTLSLFRKSYVPRKWKIIETMKIAYRIPIYLIFSKNKSQSLRYILIAILHAFNNTSGELVLR